MAKAFPPPIFSNVAGTWAHSTVNKRLPDIAGRVIEENHYPDRINEALSILIEDINNQAIRPLLDQGAPDQESWAEYISPHDGQTWLDVPWFFAEHYFYRRIIEAIDYFQLGQDPFGYQKEQGLLNSYEEIQHLSKFLQERIEKREDPQETLREGIYFSLWGNQADLSLWPAGSDSSPKHGSQKSLQDHLLANDIQQVIKLLCEGRVPLARVDLLLDNAGFELITDLALADILLSYDLVKQVVLQAKAHPTFVSDVILTDIEEAIRFLSAQSDLHTQSFSERLKTLVHSGRLLAQSHFFWNSPLPMWELPEDLRSKWAGSSLVISKGDANYRRLLGDLQWDITLPFPNAVDYLPVPLTAFRTLKAELAVGLDLDQIRRVRNQDSDWMVDGRWGVIHYAEGKGSSE